MFKNGDTRGEILRCDKLESLAIFFPHFLGDKNVFVKIQPFCCQNFGDLLELWMRCIDKKLCKFSDTLGHFYSCFLNLLGWCKSN